VLKEEAILEQRGGDSVGVRVDDGALRQNTKVKTCTNEERRRAERASPTLHHVL
jgi:hypothetical protein